MILVMNLGRTWKWMKSNGGELAFHQYVYVIVAFGPKTLSVKIHIEASAIGRNQYKSISILGSPKILEGRSACKVYDAGRLVLSVKGDQYTQS